MNLALVLFQVQCHGSGFNSRQVCVMDGGRKAADGILPITALSLEDSLLEMRPCDSRDELVQVVGASTVQFLLQKIQQSKLLKHLFSPDSEVHAHASH